MKVNNPLIQFPILIKTKYEALSMEQRLLKLGYKNIGWLPIKKILSQDFPILLKITSIEESSNYYIVFNHEINDTPNR